MGKEEEHVKKRILYAAKKLTARKGFDSTTVREVCAEAEANLSLVSYYYGGKEHVFEAMLDTFIPIAEVSAVLAERRPEPVEGVCTLVREIVYFRKSDPEIARVIHQELTRETPRTQQVRDRIMPGWMLMRQFLEGGRAAGHFRFRSLDMTLVQMIGSILFGDERSGLVSAMTNAFPDDETQLDDVLTFIMGGIGYAGEARFAGELILPDMMPVCGRKQRE